MKVKSVYTLFIFCSLFGCGDDNLPPNFDEQLELDISIIDSYLEANDINAKVDESGIRYVETAEGIGDSPGSGSGVIVKYKGSFLDGRVFDSNDSGIAFDLNGLIQAWQIMLPKLREGGKITIFAPSVYCYGAFGNGPIPPNRNLIFEIELVSLVRSFEEQLSIDLEKIDKYLENEGIDALKHSSGIRYVSLKEGEGLSPILTDVIGVDYKGLFFNGEVFDEQTIIDLRLNNTIDAWRTMLPTMKSGGKIVIYAPSGFCYGTRGNSVIPPNENLIFEIELLNVPN